MPCAAFVIALAACVAPFVSCSAAIEATSDALPPASSAHSITAHDVDVGEYLGKVLVNEVPGRKPVELPTLGEAGIFTVAATTLQREFPQHFPQHVRGLRNAHISSALKAWLWRGQRFDAPLIDRLQSYSQAGNTLGVKLVGELGPVAQTILKARETLPALAPESARRSQAVWPLRSGLGLADNWAPDEIFAYVRAIEAQLPADEHGRRAYVTQHQGRYGIVVDQPYSIARAVDARLDDVRAQLDQTARTRKPTYVSVWKYRGEADPFSTARFSDEDRSFLEPLIGMADEGALVEAVRNAVRSEVVARLKLNRDQVRVDISAIGNDTLAFYVYLTHVDPLLQARPTGGRLATRAFGSSDELYTALTRGGGSIVRLDELTSKDVAALVGPLVQRVAALDKAGRATSRLYVRKEDAFASAPATLRWAVRAEHGSWERTPNAQGWTMLDPAWLVELDIDRAIERLVEQLDALPVASNRGLR